MTVAHKPRVFMGLYGLNRSLAWTRRSIIRSFVAPIRAAGLSLDVAAHFNKPRFISSARSNERNVRAREPLMGDLDLDVMVVERQHEDRIPPTLHRFMRPHFPNDGDSDWQGRRNLIYQLYSLKRLWQTYEATPRSAHDVVLFVRPDLEYLDPIEIASVVEAIVDQGVDLITPDWGRFGGLNDRFAFCSPRGAMVYASRLDHVERFCTEHGFLQAEQLLLEVAQHGGLTLGSTSVRGMRVRADGGTVREGFDLSAIQYLRSVTRKRLVRLGVGSPW